MIISLLVYGDQDALDSIDDYNRFEEREVFNDQEGHEPFDEDEEDDEFEEREEFEDFLEDEPDCTADDNWAMGTLQIDPEFGY